MFVVTEAEAAAIRAIYQQRGELSAAIELRRLFPGITDNAQARECARTSPACSRCGRWAAEAAAVTSGALTRVGVALRRWGYRPLASRSNTSPWQGRGAHQQTRSSRRSSGSASISCGCDRSHRS
jgi:hypothetical protein